MNSTPKDLKEFENLKQHEKCTWMYMTLTNHLHALKEMKWWVRGIGIGAIVAVIRVWVL